MLSLWKEKEGKKEWEGSEVKKYGVVMFFFFFKQKTAYEIVSRDWSSDVCSSDLEAHWVSLAHVNSGESDEQP